MLLLIGFPEEEIEKVRDATDMDILPVDARWENEKLKDIVMKKPLNEYQRLGEQRIVIMHDVEKEEISPIMKGIRGAINEHIIFATTTPTSLDWELYRLIEELLEEDEYFRSR